MYHRVADLVFDPWRLAVTPAHFDEQMQVLSEYFRPVPLAELSEDPGRDPRPRSVAVTFDDGHRDGLEEAKPVLLRHGIPATVFVVSGYVDSDRPFWWDELEHLCFHGNLSARDRIDGLVVRDLPPGDRYLDLWGQLQLLPAPERRERLDRLAEAAGTPVPAPRGTLSHAELKELAEGGLVEIGGHTVNHPSLPSLPAEEQLEEIRGSRIQLERLLDRPVTSFCYPHGAFTADTVALVREAGFARACVSVEGPVRAGADRFQLPRRRAENWRGDEFGWHLSRFFR
jgi:peptidoglycan/xylan/chitin deacetylase (PgdA/CDA1 family)